MICSLERMLRYMEWELQYHLTPLPELCRQAAKDGYGGIREVMMHMAAELDQQIEPDALTCMKAALRQCDLQHGRIYELLLQLGQTLGRFDLPGQLEGLKAVRSACRAEQDALSQNRVVRLRSYRTLGLCAGAALAILFL